VGGSTKCFFDYFYGPLTFKSVCCPCQRLHFARAPRNAVLVSVAVLEIKKWGGKGGAKTYLYIHMEGGMQIENHQSVTCSAVYVQRTPTAVSRSYFPFLLLFKKWGGGQIKTKVGGQKIFGEGKVPFALQ